MKSFAGFKLYCVNSAATDKKTAADLAAWLTNTENQKTRFLTRNLIPVSTLLENDIDVAESTTAKAVMAQGPNSVAMPSIPEMDNFWKNAGSFTYACYNGDYEIEELQTKLSELAAIIKGE